MRIDNTNSKRDKEKKKKKRKESTLEAMIFEIMRKSIRDAINASLDDIFKEWK